VVDAVRVWRHQTVQAIIAALIEGTLLPQWVEQPELGDTAHLVFGELLSPVAGDALGANDLNDQIGGLSRYVSWRWVMFSFATNN
jgi:hypothetical protein